MRHDQFSALAEGAYEAVIDSSLADGSMSYGEMLIRGSSTDEVLISTHVCHPSMCNDNLSGIALATKSRTGSRTAPALSVPGRFRPRDNRIDHLAGAEPEESPEHQARACFGFRGGPGEYHVQKKQKG